LKAVFNELKKMLKIDYINKLMIDYLFDDRILVFLFNVLSRFGMKTDLPIVFQFGPLHSFLSYFIVHISPLVLPCVHVKEQ
jgi:hypothetical protein